MYSLKYPHLFEPIQLAGAFFRNRIFASPTGYQNVIGDGYLNDGAEAYYSRKAMGGAASVASCECIVDGKFGKGGAKHIALDTPFIDTQLARISYGISAYGAVATMELQHTGMFANRDLSIFGAESKGVAYGPVECELEGRHILPMTDEIIERTINKFIDGAAIAQKCGFGMVLIHAGHGWGLHQFLSPVTNTRKDQWGGQPVENRCRMLVAIIQGIKKKCGKNFPVEVRMSGSECYSGGYDIDNGIAVAKQIDGLADLIHVSAGNHEVAEVFAVTHPSMFEQDGCNVKYAAEIKKHVKAPVATVGGLSDPDLMEEIIASGKADVVELGRALLADPDFVNKIRSGNENNARRCLRCLSCFSSELSNGEPYCAINPESGRELECKHAFPCAKVSKKVLVVGGGIGGMQAALSCADRGHQVVLYEKDSRLGGIIRCEEQVSFKKNLDYYLNQQARFIDESPSIEVHLNTTVTPEVAKNENADVIITALGAEQVIPGIDGIHNENVLGAVDAYKNMDQVGKKVVILGAGLVGVELGLHLASNGRDVSIVEMMDHINDGGNFLHMLGLNVEIEKYQLKIHFNTAAKQITGNCVIGTSQSKEIRLDADTVIYAVGMKPLRDEVVKLCACAPEFYAIGDCITPRSITAATTEGYMAGRNIGRF